MLARIFTRLFYAAIFFALGVWAAPSVSRFGATIDQGAVAGSSLFDGLWAWAESTIGKPPAAWGPGPIARTASAPAPAPVTAAPPAPAKPAPAPAATPAPARSVAAPAVDPLDGARAAAARGDVSGAIRTYEDLIAERQDDAALRGELGNVYWSAGRLQDAAKAYHAAALTLLAARRIDDAARLEVPIRKGDAALADDLLRRLAEARSRG